MRSLLLLLIAGMTSGFVTGQSLTNKSTLFIGSSSVLYVGGDLVNDSLIINNGDMQVGGSWTNNKRYDAGTGQITFNSDLPQTINHQAQSFSRLTISGGGIKNFPADILIEDELNLEEGTLVSQNGSVIVFSPTSQITGGSDQAHINGTVVHQGSGNKLFPVGNGTNYLPVEISGIEETSEVGISLVEFSTPENFDFREELADVSSKRYWKVDLISGSLSGTEISLPVKGDEGFSADASKYVVVQSAASPVEFVGLGQSQFTGSVSDGTIVSKEAVTSELVTVGVLSEGITVYNAVSANGDEKNAILGIRNLSIPNKVTIFNRWGDKVFEMSNYDNDQRVFRGQSNVNGNSDLPAGNYFYVIDTKNGKPAINGFLSLKR